ncbi:TonB-dependent receptor [Chondrinema litorale]|uniref:TonB-dependent receptor n=1 Tax=Chondrinema litorale TaxID=2994555 RepID=UPI0025428FFA|nr:TonB-dependent receptor [Chondrinema litorale]UZR95558.1 TonB-dependent receptor [Chondrinema litorale]
MIRSLQVLLIAVCLSFLQMEAFSQGTTSSRMTGTVVAEEGPLPGATVLATHTPTGSRFGTVTNSEGIFTINNMSVGGPYTVQINFVGYQEIKKEGIYLTLGQTYQLSVELSESAQQLDEIEVLAAPGDVFDGNKTGAETFVSKKTISEIPTVERGLNDYTRLTPQANVSSSAATNEGAISFAGVNNRFNAIFIDGAVNNDVFGLANSGTNGGQAGISPISPDAIEQIQVVLAPYDVTLGGFAGGGINAVTRSGTNEFEGSVYYYFRNQNLSGKTPTDDPDATREKLADFNVKTYGARLGGPIIKNKLFFFTNVEFQRNEEPKPFISGNYVGNSSVAEIEELANFVRNTYNYEPGGFLNNAETTDGTKILAKLDWNINDSHKLSVRHSYVKGDTKIFPRPNNTSVIFENVGYIFPSTTNSFAAELKSSFGSNASNSLIFGVTTVRDDRDVLGDPFPQIILDDGNGASITIGTDNFSYSNIVNQDVFTLTNNFNLYKGKHTFTFGTHNEFFKIQNLFTIFSTPRYQYFFNGRERFMNGDDADLVLFGHEQLAEGQDEIRLGDAATNLGPTFKALQMAFYAQDEIQFTEHFKLTAGIRVDVPIFLEDPPLINTDFNENTVPLIEEYYDLKGARASNTPNTQLLWSPRVGFNWDVSHDKSTQLRGGIGIFSSRVPWVWPGGMYIRNGLNSNFVVSGGVPVLGTPEEWKANLYSPTSPAGDVDLFIEDFKYPQVFRSSIAVDQKLPAGLVGSVEFLYTKTMNNIDVKSVNVKPAIGTLEGADNRPIFDYTDAVDGTYENITLVDNTNEGYTWNFTASIMKPFENGLTASLAYSYTRAESLFDGTGFINDENWESIQSVNGKNNASLSRSFFDVGSRVIGFVSYKKEYLDHFATTISLFYNGQSGQPYSYVYNDEGTLTNESNGGSATNLVYVPENQGEILLIDQVVDGNVVKTAAQQWAELDAFIANDEYLSSRRGDYAERNMSRTPFENIIDLKILQDFYITGGNGMKHTLQVSFDIFNFTNLINKNWGRRYFVSDNQYQLINFEGFVGDTEQPSFTFNDPGTPYDIIQSGIYSARWSAQLGLRYSF